ncbi:MAG: FAD-binding oxidoreductase [Pseudomonadota bacterium]
MATIEADLAIIGTGIIGASCAYQAVKRGLKVVMVDARMPTAGTSGACDGYVSISSKKPGLVMELAALSKRLYPEVIADLGRDVEYRTCGGLLIIEDPATLPLIEERAAGVRSYGFDMVALDRAGMLAVEPNLSPALHGAYRCPAEAIVNPFLMTLGLVARTVARGARTVWQAKPIGVDIAGDRIVAIDTSAGRIVAEQFLFSAGVWSSALGALVGLDFAGDPAARRAGRDRAQPGHRDPLSDVGELSRRQGRSRRRRDLDRSAGPARPRLLPRGQRARPMHHRQHPRLRRL